MIIIPMAGMSSRFFKAGYTKPKYMLEANGKTLFEHSINSFRQYFEKSTFLFIVRERFSTYNFVSEEAKRIGIKAFHIVVLDEDTRGQAETVAQGLVLLEAKGFFYDGAITVFNIDTFRPGFIYPEISETCDGYLEVFRGQGDNWSFAQPALKGETKVIQTAEKKPISDLCSTGLYYFKNKSDYLEAYFNYLKRPCSEWEQGELYIAPLYNLLINKGLDIHYHLIEKADVIFCGVPDEYEYFKKIELKGW